MGETAGALAWIKSVPPAVTLSYLPPHHALAAKIKGPVLPWSVLDVA